MLLGRSFNSEHFRLSVAKIGAQSSTKFTAHHNNKPEAAVGKRHERSKQKLHLHVESMRRSVMKVKLMYTCCTWLPSPTLQIVLNLTALLHGNEALFTFCRIMGV